VKKSVQVEEDIDIEYRGHWIFWNVNCVERLINQLFLIDVSEELSSMENVDGFMFISSVCWFDEEEEQKKRRKVWCYSVHCHRKRRD